ncbi:hypothetical protein V6N13_030028 [Hibiscus sabdariffa]
MESDPSVLQSESIDFIIKELILHDGRDGSKKLFLGQALFRYVKSMNILRLSLDLFTITTLDNHSKNATSRMNLAIRSLFISYNTLCILSVDNLLFFCFTHFVEGMTLNEYMNMK